MSPQVFDPAAAAKLLAGDGFRFEKGVLRDRSGTVVEFSIITNAGNKARERMAAMIQEDLAKLGIKINIVTLDFPSLIERMTRTLNYEACLLGLVNVDPDPNELMNVLLSSAGNHPWNPSQKAPATPWEAEIDRLMLAQAATADHRARKKSFDRVQEILREQEPNPFICCIRTRSRRCRKQVDRRQTDNIFPRTHSGTWSIGHDGKARGRRMMAPTQAQHLRGIRAEARIKRRLARRRGRRDPGSGRPQRRGEEHDHSLSILGLLALKGSRCAGEDFFPRIATC